MRSLREGKNHPYNAASLLIFGVLFKKFRCFNAENLGSVGQRAAKLLAVNIGGLKKKSAIRPRPQSASLPGFDSGRSRIILKV